MTSARLDEIKLRLARGDYFEDDRLDIAWLLRQLDEAEKRIEELGQHEVSQGIIEARGEEYVHVDLVAAKVAAAKAEGAREATDHIVVWLTTTHTSVTASWIAHELYFGEHLSADQRVVRPRPVTLAFIEALKNAGASASLIRELEAEHKSQSAEKGGGA